MNRSHFIAGCLLASLNLPSYSAEACLDNFTAEGNLLTGKTYKTFASIDGVSIDDAFARAARFTAGNGFTIASADRQLGMISAAQSGGQGKTAPLSITFQPEGGTTRVAISYGTPAGVFSPEDSIKRHFCLTIAAAADATAPGATTTGTGRAVQPSPAAPGAVGGGQAPAMRGFAAATPAQRESISAELAKAQKDPKLRGLVADAAPAVGQLTERLACLSEPMGAKALDDLVAPSHSLSNMYMMLRPMASTRYHDKASCLSVVRIHGWKAPALNALTYEVVYRADDSGETAKSNHEIVRQPDGTWLFTR